MREQTPATQSPTPIEKTMVVAMCILGITNIILLAAMTLLAVMLEVLFPLPFSDLYVIIVPYITSPIWIIALVWAGGKIKTLNVVGFIVVLAIIAVFAGEFIAGIVFTIARPLVSRMSEWIMQGFIDALGGWAVLFFPLVFMLILFISAVIYAIVILAVAAPILAITVLAPTSAYKKAMPPQAKDLLHYVSYFITAIILLASPVLFVISLLAMYRH